MRSISFPIKKYELFDLIEAGEGIDIEFKRQFSSPEKIASSTDRTTRSRRALR